MEVSFNETTGVLTLKVQTTEPTPSKAKQATGKGMDLIASTGGFVLTSVKKSGKPIRISLNAGI